jgi:hypothetical protein
MKRNGFNFCVALALLLIVSACGSGNSPAADAGGGDPAAASKPAFDQTDPSQVVSMIFAVAGGKAEAKMLAELCDPQGENDGDTRRICDNAAGFDAGGEFAMFFKEGKLKGPARVQGDAAVVEFLFGPNGDESESMELVRRGDKWYLSSF